MTDPNLPEQPAGAVPPVPPAAPAAPASGAQQQAPSAPAYGAAPPAPAYGAPAAKPSQVLSILSLVGGIVGLVASFFYFGLLFSIAAVVLGFIAKKKEPASKGMWLTGIILGFVGLVIGIIFIILAIVAFAVLASVGTTYGSY
ncbi:DUF4190 domain-containing protein [Agromyces laixinhei]|uniref:DUF4190 domain-containing protein n=1 Tax=Agromyces laixinhei TaxID=2585717 RepID=UPI001116FA93|nr:DUF4190 domain-containing protein [Agromyces laixinhei]